MANIPSVAKRARQAAKRNIRNSALKATMRTARKKMAKTIDEGNKDNILELLPVTLRMFDKMVSKHIIHKNTAARNKSRLVATVNKTLAAASA